MTTIPGSVRVGGFIAPSDTTDVYPTHEDVYGKGGFQPVADTTARDAIPNERRKEGMWVKVLADGKVYTLSGGIGDEHWVEQTMGGGSIDEDTTYYVDGTTGDDANDGLAWLTAKATFGFLNPGEADAIPREINADFICYFRGDILARTADGHLRINGFYGSGTMSFIGELTAVETLTCTTYENDPAVRHGRISVTDGTKAWESKEWRRHFLKITGDTNYYPIYDNSGTTLYFPRTNDLAGTPAATIYSAPELLDELITNPGVKYAFGYNPYHYFAVTNCTLTVNVTNLWTDELGIGHTALPFIDSCVWVNLTSISATSSYSNFVNRLQYENCYFNLNEVGYVFDTYSMLNFLNCAFGSTDDTGWGFNAYSHSTAWLYGCIFDRQEYAIYCYSFGNVNFSLDVSIRNSAVAIALGTGQLDLAGVYGASPQMRLDTCAVGITGTGDITNWIGHSVGVWAVTKEILFGETDEGTFADLNDGILQSRVGLRIIQSNSDFEFLPLDEYDNTTSGLTAVRYQTAIDEIAASGGGGVNIATFAETAIDLVDETDFTAVEVAPYVTEGVGYLLEVTPTTATGTLTVVLYQDVARLEPVYTLVTDLSDADTYRSAEPFGFELETTGTLYGTAFVTGVGASETFDISITAGGFQPSAPPAPLPTPYGQGIEDDGGGLPRIALASDGGLAFDGSDKLVILPDLTADVTIALAVGGVSVIGAVTTTTDEDVVAKKRFTAVGVEPLGVPGPPAAGTYLTGHEIVDSRNVKWRCVSGGTPGDWLLADSVADDQADYYTAELSGGFTEVIEIITTGDVGILQRIQVWGVVDASVAEYASDFRVRIYQTSDLYGRDIIWQGMGVARQTYLTAIFAASEVEAEVNEIDMFETDDACVLFEDDERYELCRIAERAVNILTFDEALVDPSNWAADTLVCSVTEFHNVPFKNIDGTPANRGRAFLQIRNDHATNEVVFYVRVLPLNLGIGQVVLS